MGFPQAPAPPQLPAVSAAFETLTSVDVQGKQQMTRDTGQYTRDGFGRTRIDMPQMTTIQDPVAQMMYLVDPQKKVAMAIPLAQPPAPPPMPGMPQPPQMPGMPALPQAPQMPGVQVKDLGMQMIEGFKCRGTEFTVPQLPPPPQMPGMPGMPQVPGMPGMPQVPGMAGMPQVPGMPSVPGMPPAPGMPQVPQAQLPPIVSQSWMSEELGMELRNKSEQPGMISAKRYFNVVKSPPLDPGLFQPPAGFRILTPPDLHNQTMQNLQSRLGQVPGIGKLPPMPQLAQVPQAPQMPGMPGLPQVPKIPGRG